MSQPPETRHDPQPLEPWALELESAEPEGVDPRRREELERLVALLRSLPEPEAPPGLSEKILARVAEESARPRVVRAVFGAPGRVASLAMAAGIAGLLLVGDLPAPLAGWLPGRVGGTPESLAIRIPDRALAQGWTSANVLPGAQPGVGTQWASLGAGPSAAPLDHPLSGQTAWQRHLDRHLNQLQLDPHGYVLHLANEAGRDAFIAQLARRAGERGDAPEIAMRVRQSPHPTARRIVQRLLRASLVEHVSRR